MPHERHADRRGRRGARRRDVVGRPRRCYSTGRSRQIRVPPDDIARLVLVSVETYDNYPPACPAEFWRSRVAPRGGLALAAQLLRLGPLQRLPLTPGRMSTRKIPREVISEWLVPVRANGRIRRDVRKYVTNTRRGRADLVEANQALAAFGRPVLVLWGADDRVMPKEAGDDSRAPSRAAPSSRFPTAAR
jgi:pimeloyl-ACP methyl ester carboxylesterase